MSLLDGLPQIMANALGTSVFRDATLYRSSKGTGPSYDPGEGTTSTFRCKALVTKFSNFSVAQGLVSGKDRKLLILAATLDTVPQEGDRLKIQGTTYRVASDGGGGPAVTSDPANATYTCRGRA